MTNTEVIILLAACSVAMAIVYLCIKLLNIRFTIAQPDIIGVGLMVLVASTVGLGAYNTIEPILPAYTTDLHEYKDAVATMEGLPEIAACDLENIVAPVFSNDRLRVVLVADSFTYKGVDIPAVLVRPRVTRFNEVGDTISYAEADTGTIISKEGLTGIEIDTLNLKGSVVIRQYSNPLEEAKGK